MVECRGGARCALIGRSLLVAVEEAEVGGGEEARKDEEAEGHEQEDEHREGHRCLSESRVSCGLLLRGRAFGVRVIPYTVPRQKS